MAADLLEARSRTIDAAEAGERLGLSPRTLANLRSRRTGPPYLRVGGRIRYRITELAGWLDGLVQAPGADRNAVTQQLAADAGDEVVSA